MLHTWFFMQFYWAFKREIQILHHRTRDQRCDRVYLSLAMLVWSFLRSIKITEKSFTPHSDTVTNSKVPLSHRLSSRPSQGFHLKFSDAKIARQQRFKSFIHARAELELEKSRVRINVRSHFHNETFSLTSEICKAFPSELMKERHWTRRCFSRPVSQNEN